MLQSEKKTDKGGSYKFAIADFDKPAGIALWLKIAMGPFLEHGIFTFVPTTCLATLVSWSLAPLAAGTATSMNRNT